MSKSVGNVFGLGEALQRFGPQTLLMYFSQGHWRQPLEYDEGRLREAAATARRVREAGRRLIPGPSPDWSTALRGQFFDALAHDFNTPKALVAVFEWVRRANRSEAGTVGADDLLAMLDVLGLAGLIEHESDAVPESALELAQRRDLARRERDYGEADRLRDLLREHGLGGPGRFRRPGARAARRVTGRRCRISPNAAIVKDLPRARRKLDRRVTARLFA